MNPVSTSNPPDPTSPPERLLPGLEEVVLDVLGDLAFMVGDDQPAGFSAATGWMQGEITYRGPRCGTLRCWCTRGFATKLAANLLGIESDEVGAQVSAQDAIREFLNVLCGQLITAWHGKAEVFNLSLPIVREGVQLPDEPTGQYQACRLSIEGEPLLCWHLPG